jgi:hypothetical protein
MEFFFAAPGAAPEAFIGPAAPAPSVNAKGSGRDGEPSLVGPRAAPKTMGPQFRLSELSAIYTCGTFGPSCQPCWSRTWTITRRMSFHVCGLLITSLGNMQPSQQM